MAFVRDLFERIRHPGVHPRGPALTLSDHVEELERQDESRREQSRRQHARRKPQPRKRETPEPMPKAAPDTNPVAEGEAGRRWVPRSF